VSFGQEFDEKGFGTERKIDGFSSNGAMQNEDVDVVALVSSTIEVRSKTANGHRTGHNHPLSLKVFSSNSFR